MGDEKLRGIELDAREKGGSCWQSRRERKLGIGCAIAIDWPEEVLYNVAHG